MKPFWNCFAVAALLVVESRLPAQGGKAAPKLNFGAVLENHVYLMTKDEKSGGMRLTRVKLPDGESQHFATFARNEIEPGRWRIGFDFLWLSSAAGRPGQNEPSYVRSSHRISLTDLLGGKPGDASDFRRLQMLMAGRNAVTGIDKSNSKIICFLDFLPLSANAARVFLLCNLDSRAGKSKLPEAEPQKEKWTFRAWQFTTPVGPNPKVSKQQDDLEGSWTEEEEMVAGFKERFHVFSGSGHYFFVTESGKLYCSRKSTKGPRTMEPCWVYPNHPITHMITDADHDRTYACGKFPEPSGNKDELFIFDLSGQPTPHLVTSIPVKAEEPIMQFARAIKEVQVRIEKTESSQQEKPKKLGLLESDPWLRASLNIIVTDPDLNDLLGRLRQRTGLTLTLDDSLKDHRPKFGDVEIRHIPAYTLMGLIARTDLEEGRWEKIEGGYRLVGRPLTQGGQPDKKIPEAQPIVKTQEPPPKPPGNDFAKESKADPQSPKDTARSSVGIKAWQSTVLAVLGILLVLTLIGLTLLMWRRRKGVD